jgi:hypothetical protein
MDISMSAASYDALDDGLVHNYPPHNYLPHYAPELALPHHPLWMGQYSGISGQQGRRVKPPPALFPRRAPSRQELGISTAHDDDQSKWPLHIKQVGHADWDRLLDMVSEPDLREAVLLAREWVETATHYGVDWAPLAPCQIPFSRFAKAHIEEW